MLSAIRCALSACDDYPGATQGLHSWLIVCVCGCLLDSFDYMQPVPFKGPEEGGGGETALCAFSLCKRNESHARRGLNDGYFSIFAVALTSMLLYNK